MTIWHEHDCKEWHQAFDSYRSVVEQQGDERLSNLDRWYHGELRTTLLGRDEPHILHEELEGIAGWKMRRGVWRERNRRLVGGNPPELVIELSRNAFAEVPDLRKPITTLSKLAGVGPATASAVLTAYAPEVYPFLDEVVAGQIPSLGEVDFTTKYYIAYAEAIRGRSAELTATCTHKSWTPHEVDQALWVVGMLDTSAEN